jgi:hypothetical protein
MGLKPVIKSNRRAAFFIVDIAFKR